MSQLPTRAVHPLAAIPPQRTAADPIGRAPTPATSRQLEAARRWTLVRALLLPVGAMYVYAGSMTGMAALDRLVGGTAVVALLASPVAALAAAVLAAVLVVTGARLVRGVLAH
ncbi:MAG TPA: hypothetical protein VFO98_05750 [Marmoricola sp.]|jgi:hypothetical protein|nr:hypothetical protein [Marmoricola sp.]